LTEVRFALFSDRDLAAYEAARVALGGI
jgi:hypothetical protein